MDEDLKQHQADRSAAKAAIAEAKALREKEVVPPLRLIRIRALRAKTIIFSNIGP